MGNQRKPGPWDLIIRRNRKRRKSWAGYRCKALLTLLLTRSNCEEERQQVGRHESQSCLTLCYPMGVYTVHGILQARILEWVAFTFSRGSSQPRDRTQVFCIAGDFFTSWAMREAQEYWSGQPIPSPGDLLNPGMELGSPTLQVDSLPTEPPEKQMEGVKISLMLDESVLRFSWDTQLHLSH